MSINHIYQNAEGGALAKTITGTVSVNGGISNVPYTAIIDRTGYCTITISQPLTVTVVTPTPAIQLFWYTTIPSDIELLKCSAISPQYSTFIWVLDFIDPSGNGFFDLSSGRLPALLRRDKYFKQNKIDLNFILVETRRVELRFLCLSDPVAYRCSPPDIPCISGNNSIKSNVLSSNTFYNY